MSNTPTNRELLHNPPCFRTGMMWGIACGTLVGLHQFRNTRHVRIACDYAILSFGVVAAGSWFICRATYLGTLQQIRQMQHALKHKEPEFNRSQVLTKQDPPKEQF
uniref:Cytochrome c oxidase assembly protein COX20, mitochondrial n=1 Tax=Albugo laibachii Nc14 TaxID=890382 RepID=F0WR82_9STRA|nr:conserved hypothetical protein [Albugo laibachii Nc14]|eukprot:CCA23843.1 conserved hypothetical protein [Albugo laibachii Nc14]